MVKMKFVKDNRKKIISIMKATNLNKISHKSLTWAFHNGKSITRFTNANPRTKTWGDVFHIKGTDLTVSFVDCGFMDILPLHSPHKGVSIRKFFVKPSKVDDNFDCLIPVEDEH